MTHLVRTENRPCGGEVVVDTDRRVTCTDPQCHVPDGWHFVLDTHDIFTPCATMLGPTCPICFDVGTNAELPLLLAWPTES